MNLDNKIIKRDRPAAHEGKALQLIHDKLEQLKIFFEREILNKQLVINEKVSEICHQKAIIAKKDASIKNLEHQLRQVVQKEEGNRQLINKLLNDIEKYQNDIEWFKRTYEKRSILGVLKDKIMKQ